MSREKKTDLSTEKGHIYIYTTTDSNLDIEAQTLKGKISTTIPFTVHQTTLQVNSKSIAELENISLVSLGNLYPKQNYFAIPETYKLNHICKC